MITVVPAPSLAGARLELVLAEDNLGHYPEFRAFFSRTFDLDRVGLAQPGYVQAASGAIYALVFVGRSGEPFPSGIEISAILPALEPFDEASVDRDLWAILRWMIEGVGGEWTAEALAATGRLFGIPAGMDGNPFRT
jgi:hypothetical protein